MKEKDIPFRRGVRVCQRVDADTFWVIETNPSKSKDLFNVFETELNNSFNEKLKNLTSSNSYFPKKDEFTIVKKNGKFYRSLVNEQLTGPNDVNPAVQVYLVDYGELLKVEALNIFKVEPGFYHSEAYRTKKVILHGVSPISLEFAFLQNLTLRMQRSKKWDISAKNFIFSIVNVNDSLELEIVSQEENCVYGRLFINLTSEVCGKIEKFWEVGAFDSSFKRMNLSDILIGCRFGTLADDKSYEGFTNKNQSQFSFIPFLGHLPKSTTTDDFGCLWQSSHMKSSGIIGREVSVGLKTPHNREFNYTSTTASKKVERKQEKVTLSEQYSNSPLKDAIPDSGKLTYFTNHSVIPQKKGTENTKKEMKTIPSKTRTENSLSVENADKVIHSNSSLPSPKASEMTVTITNMEMITADTFSSPYATEVQSANSSYFSSHALDHTASPLCMERNISYERNDLDELSSSVKNIEIKPVFNYSPSSDSSKSSNSQVNHSSKPQCTNLMTSSTPNTVAKLSKRLAITKSGCGMPFFTMRPVYVSGEIPIDKNQLILNEQDAKKYFPEDFCNQFLSNTFYITRLQNYSWPAIVRGRSCFLVAGKNCGKTMGFLIPLIATLLNDIALYNKSKSRILQPRTVIICYGWRNVRIIAEIISYFLPSNSLKFVSYWSGNGRDDENSLQIDLSGADILITTLPVLSRLLYAGNESIQCVSLSKCSHLVFDDADLMVPIFSLIMSRIVNDWVETAKQCNIIKQLIFTSSVWSEDMDSLLSKTDTLLPTVIISNHLEAVMAARVPTFLHYVTSEKGIFDAMLELIEKSDKRGIVIFTYEKSFVEAVEEILRAVAIHSITVKCEEMPLWMVKEKLDSFNSVLLVLDCPSNPLLSHDFKTARTVIHLGVPPSKYAFGCRYLVLMHYYPTNLLNKLTETISSHVILSDEMLNQSSYIIEELKRLGVSIPDQVILGAERQRKEDTERRGIPLCYKLKTMGECSIIDCSWRHFKKESDFPKYLPRSGDVTLDIVKVINATFYLVRLVTYKEGDKKYDMNLYYKMLFTHLQDYYGSYANRIPLSLAERGTLCSVVENRTWFRGKVVDIDVSLKSHHFTVFLIDEGKKVSRDLNKLYQLPKEFKSMPDLIVEVYLCNIQPPDSDNTWTENANNYVQDILTANKETIIFSGKIVFSLANSLWLSPIRGRKKVEKLFVNTESIRSLLLSRKFGVSKNDHITLLKEKLAPFTSFHHSCNYDDCQWFDYYEKALSGILALSSVSVVLSDEKSSVTSRETFKSNSERLQSNKRSAPHLKYIQTIQVEDLHLGCLTPVIIGQIINPLHFYVMKKENTKYVTEMEDEIQEIVDGSTTFVPFQNSICLVQLNDGRFYRGKVHTVQDSNVMALLIDHGEPRLVSKNKIYPCSPSIADMLPIQCIKCEMDFLSIPESILGLVADFMRTAIKSYANISVIAREVKFHENEKSYIIEDVRDTSTTPHRSLVKEIINSGFSVSCKQSSESPNSKVLSVTDQNSEFTDERQGNYFDVVETADNVRACDEPDEKMEVLSLSKENVKKYLGAYQTCDIESDDVSVQNKIIDLDDKTLNTKSRIRFKHLTYDSPTKSFVRLPTPALPAEEDDDKKSENRIVTESCGSDCSSLSSYLPPATGCRHPHTIWKQDNRSVCLRFSLPNAEIQHFKFKRSSLNFSALQNGNMYVFNETLFANIQPDLCNLSVKGGEFVVVLIKCKEGKWPRLLWSKEKLPWLKPDLMDVDVSSISTEYSVSKSLYEDDRKTADSDLPVGFPDCLSDSDETLISSSSDEVDNIFKFG